MTKEQAEQRALELYPEPDHNTHWERERVRFLRDGFIKCYDEMLTEADLVSFGNFLLKDRSEGNYLMSNNLVTHADLENWKELKQSNETNRKSKRKV